VTSGKGGERWFNCGAILSSCSLFCFVNALYLLCLSLCFSFLLSLFSLSTFSWIWLNSVSLSPFLKKP
jgi:hypothetical protein